MNIMKKPNQMITLRVKEFGQWIQRALAREADELCWDKSFVKGKIQVSLIPKCLDRSSNYFRGKSTQA